MRSFLRLLPFALLLAAAPAYAQSLPTTIVVRDGNTPPQVLTVPTLQAVIDTLDNGLAIAGFTAADAPIAAAPITVGGRGSNTTPTPVSGDGDVVNAWMTLTGATVVSSDALDNAAYGPSTSRPFVAGFVVDDVGTDSVNEGDAGYGRMLLNRVPFSTIRDGDGNERGLKITSLGAAAVDCVTCAGTVAAGASSSGVAVVYSGGQARSSAPTAEANGDAVPFVTDLYGRQIVLPYTIPENLVSGVISSAMTGTTSTSLIASPGVGLRNYITQLTCSNAHATQGTDILIQDGSGGTTLYVLPAAAVYGGAALTFPAPLRQPTTATAVFVANVTTGASTKCAASGYKAG
jgi:hypothetical protein